jgi:hypothetical protein
MAAGLDFKIVPQKIVFDYRANEMGFANSNAVYNNDLTFTNLYTDLFIRMGYAYVLPKQHSLTLAFGMKFNIPVNGKRADADLVYLNTNGDQYNELVMYRVYGFGTRKPEGTGGWQIPFNTLMSMQLGYNVKNSKLLNGHGMNIGLDFTSRLMGNLDNRMSVDYFSENRAYRGSSRLKDNFLSVGLFVGIDI